MTSILNLTSKLMKVVITSIYLMTDGMNVVTKDKLLHYDVTFFSEILSFETFYDAIKMTA